MAKLRPTVTVEELNQRSGENLPGLMGVEMVELSEGALKSQMKLRQVHFAPNTYLHAASVIALADTTCGYATIAHLPEGAESFTTIELKSNHLGTVRGEGAMIRCTATAQHLGGEHSGMGCRRHRCSNKQENRDFSLYTNGTLA